MRPTGNCRPALEERETDFVVLGLPLPPFFVVVATSVELIVVDFRIEVEIVELCCCTMQEAEVLFFEL